MYVYLVSYSFIFHISTLFYLLRTVALIVSAHLYCARKFTCHVIHGAHAHFCPRNMESCHLAAARRVKLWSLNANLLFEEPHQLTKFAHIWQRTFPFKALIAIFWDLQPLWPSSITKPDLLRFRCSSGHVPSKTKSVTPPIFFTFPTSLTHHLSMVEFSEKNQC